LGEEEKSDAGLFGWTRLNNRYLLGIKADFKFDLYISNTESILEGFDEDAFVRWNLEEKVPELISSMGDFQSLDFLNQCEGRLFMLGFHNTSDLSPLLPGKDIAYLFEVSFPSEDFDQIPEIKLVDSKDFACDYLYCNFDAGTGAYISSSDEIWLYSVSHFRQRSQRDAPQMEVLFKQFTSK
jgi:hypothetical protein